MKDKKLIFLLIMLAVIVLSAVFAPLIAPYSPYEIDLSNRFAPISSSHILGTDHLGRDVFSRLIYGSRMSLISVLAIMVIILLVSLIIGSAAGFQGGKIDNILMRISDVMLTFPTFILALFFIGILGVGLINVIIAIAFTHLAWYSRIVRSIVLETKEKNYVLASKCMGTPKLKIIMRHIMPQVLSQVGILATLDLGHMMLHVAGLSFLGLGVQAPVAEWGVMINDAAPFIRQHPELMVYPGLCIFITVAIFNSLGEYLKDKYKIKEDCNYEESVREPEFISRDKI